MFSAPRTSQTLTTFLHLKGPHLQNYRQACNKNRI
jgi:hypothetical protein